jgi:hypothetical protein
MREALFPAILTTLDDYVGRELSPNAAAALAAALMDLVLGRPIDLADLPTARCGSFTLQPEPLIKVLPELAELHRAHWQETEGYRHGLELRPDYDWCLEQEASGKYLVLTARQGDALAANYCLYLTQSHHTQTMVASEDTMFIAPAFRGGRLFSRFAKYGEDVVRHLGAKELRLSAKLSNQVSQMLPRMGYVHVANQFTKQL